MAIIVIHSKKPALTLAYDGECLTKEDVMNMILDGHYEDVATIDTNDMDEAYMKSQHLQQSWTENEGVEMLVERVRSTSVGDILKVGGVAGDLYVVVPSGFEKLLCDE